MIDAWLLLMAVGECANALSVIVMIVRISKNSTILAANRVLGICAANNSSARSAAGVCCNIMCMTSFTVIGYPVEQRGAVYKTK